MARFVGTYRSNRYPRHEPFAILALAFDRPVTTGTAGTFRLGPDEWVEVEPLLFRRANADECMVFRENQRAEIVQMLAWNGAYDKLRWYQTAWFQMRLAVGFVLIFAPAAITSMILFRRGSSSRPELVADGTMIAVSIFNLAFMISIVALLVRVRREVLFAMPWFLIAALCVPLVALMLTMTLPAFVCLAWKRGWWSGRRRLDYTVVTAGAIGFMLFLQCWNLIGIHY